LPKELVGRVATMIARKVPRFARDDMVWLGMTSCRPSARSSTAASSESSAKNGPTAHS